MGARSAHPAEPQFDIVWPSGRRVTQSRDLAQRPVDLNGKRVGLVWDHVFRGDDIFQTFIAVTQDRYQRMSYVNHPEFGNVHGSITEEHEAIELLPERLAKLEVDAVVVGVGA
jgi:hypothetical protein